MKIGGGLVVAAVTCTLAIPALSGAANANGERRSAGADGALPGGFENLVVIYEENHSFDNLYGEWGRVGNRRVDGLQNAPGSTRHQVDQDGRKYRCLLQNDVNLTSPPLSTTCSDAHDVNVLSTPPTVVHGFDSHFRNNGPFDIDDFIGPDDTTCPAPGEQAPNGKLKGTGLKGGCTRDLVHRFYQEQYQLNDGRQNRYVTGSDAVGLTMGRYETRNLPIYEYLHSAGAPSYVVADRFFQAAFGGSFLNHQWLVAARSPLDTSNGASGALNSILDDNGMVTTYPLYTPTGPVRDSQLTQACPGSTDDDPVRACGDFAVNTIQPTSPPHAATGARLPLIDDTQFPNIGDRLSDAGISWNWYAGKWDEANTAPATVPLFQFHHQPFNYFENYAPGQPGRDHLQDETDFIASAQNGTLPKVSFVKPYGAENEHPGYASEPDGSSHLVDLIQDVVEGPQADKTLIVVTYDEFGGQWDHVAPPGTRRSHVDSAHDAWGPSTRIPALVVASSLRRSNVDHTAYDTTSILATIERSFGLAPLSTRDAAVNDLSSAVAAGGR